MEEFPIMSHKYGERYGTIPFAMLEQHREQALLNHSQSLERLAERGGLSPDEALSVIRDERWKGRAFKMPQAKEEYAAWSLEKWKELSDEVEQWKRYRELGIVSEE